MSKSNGTNIPNTSLEEEFIINAQADYKFQQDRQLLISLSISKAILTPAAFHGTTPNKKSQEDNKVVTAVRLHLFPSRTEKLSSPTPMVLLHQVGE